MSKATSIVKPPLLELVEFGAGGVGKSTLLHRFIHDTFEDVYDPTLEDTYRKAVVINSEVVLLECQDIGGQEDYAIMHERASRTGDGFLLVYSVTSKASLNSLLGFRQMISVNNKDSKNVPVIMVGNKSDLKEQRQFNSSGLSPMLPAFALMSEHPTSPILPKTCNATLISTLPPHSSPESGTWAYSSTDGPAGQTQPAGLVKCEDMWVPDGDIVLRTDNTLFRVSKAFLCQHSPIFDDLFDIPLPAVLEEGDAYDGCPVVQVFDPADHLRCFLKGLYDPSYRIVVKDNRTLRNAVGVLELSSKYETPELRERAISFIAPLYPTTLEAYRTRWDTWAKGEKFDPRNIILVANVARVTQAFTLLPSALFHYLEQYGRDVSALIDAHDAGLALGSSQYEADYPLLIKDNLSSILKARSAIIFFTRKYVYGFVFYKYPFAKQCTRDKKERCMQSKHDWAEKMDGLSPDGWLSPLSRDVPVLRMCQVCLSEATGTFEVKLGEFWERLPQMFDMHHWKALERMSHMP
ncbi:Ras GTPase [Steccherinum ochraceum]|uniref:Ras GTPase n=1 Tax=Steccherinum ochraceum TaxID=92696 RepID=A0A4R0RI83_9APHY|nr:Ras GTPase [Steccherinum ochraceum]